MLLLMEYEHTNNSTMKITLIIISVNKIIIKMWIIIFSHIMLPELVEMYPVLGSDIMKWNVYGIVIHEEQNIETDNSGQNYMNNKQIIRNL
jgi:hypothetical protein